MKGRAKAETLEIPEREGERHEIENEQRSAEVEESDNQELAGRESAPQGLASPGLDTIAEFRGVGATDSQERNRYGTGNAQQAASAILAEPEPVENSAPSDAALVHFVEKAFAPAIAPSDDWGAFDELPQDDNSIAPTIAPTYDNWSELWRLERNGYDTNGQARFRWRLRFADTKPSRDCGLPEHVAGQIIEGGRGKGNHAQSRADSERLKHSAEYLEGELRRGKKRGTATKKRKRERQNSDRNQGRTRMPQVSRLVDRKLPDVRGGFVN